MMPEGHVDDRAKDAAPAVVRPPSNRGLNDFFATIFAGPTMLSHAFRPGESTYYAAPSGNTSPAYGPQSYATPNDPRDGPIDPKFLRQGVAYPGREAPGTIIVDTANKFLYLIEGGGRALRYGIGVGRPGFLWAGVKIVTAKREWPGWRPPAEMIARRPDLPRFMPGGIDNPLGARARFISARTCIASTVRTSLEPSAPTCRPAASACATRMSPIFISA
jgi:lipoprotein-anchoring transpeptidase ErfK/SrfK